MDHVHRMTSAVGDIVKDAMDERISSAPAVPCLDHRTWGRGISNSAPRRRYHYAGGNMGHGTSNGSC